MGKYICNKCGHAAEHVDFLNNDKEKIVSAVYVFCISCKIDAWGGLKFHPEMNEMLNTKFAPNYNYKGDGKEKEIPLIKENQ